MRAEFTAFRTLLDGGAVLSGKVETAIRREDGDPVRDNYAVLYPSIPGRLKDHRYAAPPDPNADRTLTYDVRAVATSADGAFLLADAAVQRVVGQTLTVAGRRCDPIELVEAVEEGRIQYDRTSDLYFIDMSFRFMSRRA